MSETKAKTVLMIDDDAALASMLKRFVEKYGYRLVHAAHPKQGLVELERSKPVAVLLDINLPDQSGLDVCREIRERNPVPIIMISSLGETSDRILGLGMGADSYLPKPFEPRELVALLEAVLRRVSSQASAPRGGVLKVGDLEVDLGRRQATVGGKPIELTSAEFELLAVFAGAPGHVFDRDELLNRLKGIDWDAYNRSVDIVVSRLRRKLGDSPKQPRYLKTIWGAGYVLLPQEPTRKAG